MIHSILNETELDILKKSWENNIDWEDLYPKLWEKVYNYYIINGIMPYGIAKARIGDPYDWITNRLEQDLGL